MILLDANVLLRMADRSSTQHAQAGQAVWELRRRGEVLLTCPQSFFEFWAVATRPVKTNGLGMTPPQAGMWLQHFSRLFPPVPEPPAVRTLWMQLVVDHKITGLRGHDAHYVALMQALQIPDLLTYNLDDFKKFPIHVIDPATI